MDPDGTISVLERKHKQWISHALPPMFMLHTHTQPGFLKHGMEWGTFFQAESIYQPKYQHHARNHGFHGSYHCRFQPSSAPSCAFGTQGIQVETWRSHRASAEYRSVNWPMNCCTMTNRSNNSVMLMVTVFFFKGHIMITYMITSVELSRTLFSNLHGPINIGLTEVWDNHGLEYVYIWIYMLQCYTITLWYKPTL